jgi:hypothetical protein
MCGIVVVGREWILLLTLGVEGNERNCLRRAERLLGLAMIDFVLFELRIGGD